MPVHALPLPSSIQGAVAPPVAHKSVNSELGVVHDQPERVAGTGLGPPGAPRGRVAPSDLAQHYTSLEEALHSVNTMLTMLKAQVGIQAIAAAVCVCVCMCPSVSRVGVPKLLFLGAAL